MTLARLLLPVALLVPIAVVPADASAAAVTVRVVDRNLSTPDADSEDSAPIMIVTGTDGSDHLAITEDATGILVVPAVPGDSVVIGGGGPDDSPADPTKDPRCETEPAGGVHCTKITGLEVSMGSGDDVVHEQVADGGQPIGTRLDGGPGADTLAGGAEADEIDGGPGLDVVDGGDGRDTWDGEDETGKLTVDLAEGTATTPDGSEALSHFDDAIGGDDADTMIAAPAGSSLDGGPGPDRLIGGPGADVLQSTSTPQEQDDGEGHDTVQGSAGNDSISADDGDRVSAGNGNDRLFIDDRDATPIGFVRCGAGADFLQTSRNVVMSPECERFEPDDDFGPDVLFRLDRAEHADRPHRGSMPHAPARSRRRRGPAVLTPQHQGPPPRPAEACRSRPEGAGEPVGLRLRCAGVRAGATHLTARPSISRSLRHRVDPRACGDRRGRDGGC